MKKNTVEECHAYLIIAYEDSWVFRKLFELIDDERNDIFIHMDKKNTAYEQSDIEKYIRKSKVYHTKRINVAWGGYTLIKAEMFLLKLSVKKGRYSYYHLLSGADLPVKSQDYIHHFFLKNKGKEFIDIGKYFSMYDRVNRFYFYQDKIGRNNFSANYIKQRRCLILQKRLGIRRNRRINFKKGSQWFSITDEMARYIVSKRLWIWRVFNNTYATDEIFLQTIVANSLFDKNCINRKEADCAKVQ